MYQGKKVIAIAPCLNEVLKIQKVISRIQDMNEKVVDEILIVDDGSTDGSADACRKLGATVIELGHVYGVGYALREGFSYAKKNGFDLIVILAGNNKDEPNEIPDLLKPIVESDCDFVQGSRYLKNADMGSMPLYRKIATKLHPLLFSFFSGRKVTESTNGFRAFKSTLLNNEKINLNQSWLDEYELEPYLYFKIIKLGYKTTEVACTKIYPPKSQGYTKMKPITGWWSILRPLFLLGFGIKK